MEFQYWLRMALWTAPVLLHAVIITIMIRRRLVKKFPIFFLYSFFVPARSILLLRIAQHKSMYSWVYWLAEAVVVLLGVSIVYEVLKNLVRPYSSLRVLARGVFLVGAVIAGVIGPLLLVCTASPWRTKTLIESAILMQRSLRFVHVCLLIVAGWFQSRFGLRWNRYEGGIVTGLAIAAVLDIALLELRGDLHWISHGQFVWLSPLSYNLAAVVLIAYFGPTPGRKLPPAAPPPSHLPEWNQMLREFLERRR